MKLFLTITIFFILSGFSQAQNTFPSSGNVGIGTTAPQYSLDVLGFTGLRSNLFLYGDVDGGQSNTNSPSLIFQGTDYAGASSISAPREETYGRRGIAFSTHSDPSDTRNLIERMRINYIGNVLIGKASQQNTVYKLDVAGSIRADGIIVNTSGADFVFGKEYRLRTLTNVARYIRYHNHLPEIPSAKDMEKDGSDLAQMNTKLLQKVEELTLYLIQKDKQEKFEKREIAALRKRVFKLEFKHQGPSCKNNF